MELQYSAQKQKEVPLVTVIIPAYNAERYIGETIDSVARQTYTNLEILVVDDGSKDGTAAIVRRYMHGDSRIRLIQQSNAGVAAARNHGINKSKGEFVAPIDSDDTWHPSHIEKQVCCFLNSPESVGLVYSWSLDIDEKGNATGGIRASKIEGNVFTTLICTNFLGNASSSMMRRNILDEMGGYDSTLRDRNGQGCEDWGLYLRFAERYMFKAVPACSVGYRKPLNSMSADCDQMARSHAMMMQSIRQRNPKLPNFLFRLSASNLFFYFAHQSLWRSQQRKALLWLRRAIQADPFTCWIRPGLYMLLVQSLWELMVGEPEQKRLGFARHSSLKKATSRKTSIKRILLVGYAYHWVIRALTCELFSSYQNIEVTSGGKTC